MATGDNSTLGTTVEKHEQSNGCGLLDIAVDAAVVFALKGEATKTELEPLLILDMLNGIVRVAVERPSIH